MNDILRTDESLLDPHLDKYDRRASSSFSRVKSISDQETQSKRSSRLSKYDK